MFKYTVARIVLQVWVSYCMLPANASLCVTTDVDIGETHV